MPREGGGGWRDGGSGGYGDRRVLLLPGTGNPIIKRPWKAAVKIKRKDRVQKALRVSASGGQCQGEERVSHSGGCDGARNRGRAVLPSLSSSQSGRVVSASAGNMRISAPTPRDIPLRWAQHSLRS